MATLYVDRDAYEVDPKDNLLAACLSRGLDIPYFCWHPALGSVGACRQCAVRQYRDENDTRGRIVMACMTRADDGMRISIDDAATKDFRASVIEWLMLNHPHDCPVCEEGGECHLQDMTLQTGHIYRRYRYTKRTFRNQYLGPFINHEMNRCITCYRCVRFYQDYAGGQDLQAFASKNHVYFGRTEEGTLENEFSGNLVEVCPTGVFTDKTLSERYARKWDLRGAPSICPHCSLGCNTIANERYGELRRILNRYNSEVNGYFICDRGRFGYGFVNSERRIREPSLRRVRSEPALPVAVEQALTLARRITADRTKLIGIGSPRASIEANFALRTLVGNDRFYSGMCAQESLLLAAIRDILQSGPVRTPTLRDVEQADAVLVLGEDLTNTAPRLALALRQAVRHKAWSIADGLGIAIWNDSVVRNAAQNAKSPLFVLTLCATKLDDIATDSVHGAADDLARLAFGIAHDIDTTAPAPEDLGQIPRAMARTIALALRQASRPLIISGTSSLSAALIRGAANIAWALNAAGKDTRLSYVLPDSNSLGAAILGQLDLESAAAAIMEGRADSVVVIENNLYRHAPRKTVDTILSAAHVIVVDHLHNETTEQAELLFPAGTFAEADGTLINNEGRAQRFFQALTPSDAIQESWRWLVAIHQDMPPWRTLDEVTAACAASVPALNAITAAAPDARFRIAGMKIKREIFRSSGRTAMNADVSVHEPKPPDDVDTPLTFTMEGYQGEPPPALVSHIWAPGWNSVQALHKFQQEVGGPLRGGEPGARLINPTQTHRAPAFFSAIPRVFQPCEGMWWLQPHYHIFGSEEMSILSPGIALRMPRPYVALHPDDAEQYRLTNPVRLQCDTLSLRLELQLRADLPRGVAAVPYGHPQLYGLALPAWVRIEREVV